MNPLDGTFRNSVPAFSGAGFDNVLLSTVALSIQQVGRRQCYNPVNNTFTLSACPHWFAASGSTNAWTYAFAVPPWVHAQSYVVLSSGTDAASNAQVALSSAGFTFDVLAPTATVATPGLYLNPTQSTFVGTSTDTPAGLASLQLALSSGAGVGGWLTKGGGTRSPGPSPVFFATTTYVIGNPDNWTWAPDTATLTDGANYLLRVQTTDGASNMRTQNVTFLYDMTPAVASVTFPLAGGFVDGNPTISGGSFDTAGPGGSASGVSTVAVSIMSSANGKCYVAGGGFTFSPCPNFIPATGGTPAAWTFTPAPNPFTTGVSYVILAQGTDNAGNVQSVFNTATVSSVTFTYDTGVPMVYFQMPTAVGREINLTTLSGTATDSIPSDLQVVQVRVQDTNDLNFYADPLGSGLRPSASSPPSRPGSTRRRPRTRRGRTGASRAASFTRAATSTTSRRACATRPTRTTPRATRRRRSSTTSTRPSRTPCCPSWAARCRRCRCCPARPSTRPRPLCPEPGHGRAPAHAPGPPVGRPVLERRGLAVVAIATVN